MGTTITQIHLIEFLGESKKINKWFYVVGAFVLLVVVIAAVFIIIGAKYSAKLDILVAPLSAKIEIDGKTYENGTYGFEPGEISVSITREGFLPESKSLILESGVTTKLYVYLTPLDENADWYLEHKEDMMVVMAIGDANADISSEMYSIDNPIVGILPIIYANYDEKWNYTEFRVDGGMFDDCSKTFCLKITDTTGGNREHALELIADKGFNPDDYEILYEYKPITPLE